MRRATREGVAWPRRLTLPGHMAAHGDTYEHRGLAVDIAWWIAGDDHARRVRLVRVARASHPLDFTPLVLP